MEESLKEITLFRTVACSSHAALASLLLLWCCSLVYGGGVTAVPLWVLYIVAFVALQVGLVLFQRSFLCVNRSLDQFIVVLLCNAGFIGYTVVWTFAMSTILVVFTHASGFFSTELTGGWFTDNTLFAFGWTLWLGIALAVRHFWTEQNHLCFPTLLQPRWFRLWERVSWCVGESGALAAAFMCAFLCVFVTCGGVSARALVWVLSVLGYDTDTVPPPASWLLWPSLRLVAVCFLLAVAICFLFQFVAHSLEVVFTEALGKRALEALNVLDLALALTSENSFVQTAGFRALAEIATSHPTKRREIFDSADTWAMVKMACVMRLEVLTVKLSNPVPPMKEKWWHRTPRPMHKTQEVFNEYQMDRACIHALASLAGRAQHEDRYGRMQQSLVTLLTSLLGCAAALEQHVAALTAFSDGGWLEGHQLVFPQEVAFATDLNETIYAVVLAFYEHLSEFSFPPAHTRRLQAFADFREFNK